MGEYATHNGESIKIGTCENMYYLRADQAHLVKKESGSVDPMDTTAGLRFRFPWPDEDKKEPGDFEPYSRSYPLDGLAAPKDVEHYTVQMRSDNGYLASIPCPESGKKIEGLTIHKNGFGAAVRLAYQKPMPDGKLWLVCQCHGCGALWRVPPEDSVEYIEAVRKRSSQDGDSPWQIALRMTEGYTHPGKWFKGFIN